ncbi:MAG: NAD(P)/FAD-dependent oxidoreductase [Eubacteriales bacterium]|nr:NAD(P)/FAD-dependent oxidoreductase [Eubacteriales bacterium]
MKNYDWIIVGTGAANLVSDALIDAGFKIAICEKAKFGGTCLTHGCIPSKILSTCAASYLDMINADHCSICLDKEAIKIDFQDLKRRLFNKIDESLGIADEYRDAGADVYPGCAEFLGPHEICINYGDGRSAETISGDRILVATGAKTRIPEIEGLTEASYLCPENFFDRDYPDPYPRSIAILGSGVTACEFASIFNAFGSEVYLINRRPGLLRHLDREICSSLEDQFNERGIQILSLGMPQKIESVDGLKRLHFDDGSTLEVEAIFVATGVVANADELHLDRAGIDRDQHGYIRTNEALETSQPHIFALGDINGRMQLRHKANREAEILIHNLLENPQAPKRMDYSCIPSVVFTYPEVASVGLSEEEAIKAYGSEAVICARFDYSETAKGYAMGISAERASQAFVKVVCLKENRKILGMHAIGAQASLLMQTYAYLMQAAVHPIAIIDPELGASAAVQEVRSQKPNSPEYQLDYMEIFDELLCAHPSLFEVAAWVSLGFEDEAE